MTDPAGSLVRARVRVRGRVGMRVRVGNRVSVRVRVTVGVSGQPCGGGGARGVEPQGEDALPG